MAARSNTELILNSITGEFSPGSKYAEDEKRSQFVK
jgi:hypothetical protein